jgi:hypothetical protein
VRAVCRETGKSEDSTSIVVENVAVAWALRQGFTRNKVGQAMIETAAAIGADTMGIGRILTVISAKNSADSPSRGQQAEAGLLPQYHLLQLVLVESVPFSVCSSVVIAARVLSLTDYSDSGRLV